MEDLIKRLEEATEGSRALNGAIWRVVDPQAARVADSNVRAMGNRDWTKEEADQNAENKLRRLAPAFTTSLDAALTLVPEGFSWQAYDNRATTGGSERICGFALSSDEERKKSATVWDWPSYQGKAATPPLALCIAALRAHKRG